MPDLFGRAKIVVAFDKLESELARRGFRADLFVVGGAAIALAYRQGRRTRDVGAVFENAGVVYEAARAVARRMGLPADWLNDAVRNYLIGPDVDARLVREGRSLQISIGSPRYLLAMKLLAARAEQDRDDIRLLYELCGYTSAREGVALLESYLPGRPIPERTLDILDAMFGLSPREDESRRRHRRLRAFDVGYVGARCALHPASRPGWGHRAPSAPGRQWH